MLSPSHPGIERVGDRRRDQRRSSSACARAGVQRDDRSAEAAPMIHTGRGARDPRLRQTAADRHHARRRRPLRPHRGARHPERRQRSTRALAPRMQGGRLARLEAAVRQAEAARRRPLPRARLPDLAPARVGRADPARALRRSAGPCRCRRTSCRCGCRTTCGRPARATRSPSARTSIATTCPQCGGAGAARDRHARLPRRRAVAVAAVQRAGRRARGRRCSRARN